MILILFGLPATGKSFLSKKAAKEFDAVHLNTDIIRKELNLKGKYDEHSKQKVYDHMLKQMVYHAQKNWHVIVDGTFQKKQHRKQFLQKARELNQKLHFVEMRAKEDTIKERMKSDRKHSEADFNVYQNMKKLFEHPQEPHLTLWSDENNAAELIEKLKNYLHEQSPDS
ncbi:MAG: ATP-binding protein [Bacteroidales bacterium]